MFDHLLPILEELKVIPVDTQGIQQSESHFSIPKSFSSECSALMPGTMAKPIAVRSDD